MTPRTPKDSGPWPGVAWPLGRRRLATGRLSDWTTGTAAEPCRRRRKAWWRLPAPRALVRPLLARDISRRVSPRAPRQTAPVVRRRSEVHHVVRRIHHLHHRAAAFRPSRSSRECCPADKISRRGFSPCSSAAECRAETRGTPSALPHFTSLNMTRTHRPLCSSDAITSVASRARSLRRKSSL